MLSRILKRRFTVLAQATMINAEVRGAVGLITLNRPKALNALCDELASELNAQLTSFDKDPNISCMIITGAGKAFAAGADIKEMSDQTYPATMTNDMLGHWDHLRTIKKPIIAAVNGFALGGGCELAMMCDMIIAGDRAKFGQPEIKLGVIPGMGGTQRLTRAVGKSRAMELVLTGDMFTADEAVAMGLASRVVPNDTVVDEAMKVANKISAFSKPVTALAKECVNQSYETSLKDGLLYERRMFHSCFALNDQKEGMSAFMGKREANFTDS